MLLLFFVLSLLDAVVRCCGFVFQHFTDRMHQLVQCKYMHLLRWKRFLRHTAVIESLYADFNSRLWFVSHYWLFLCK